MIKELLITGAVILFAAFVLIWVPAEVERQESRVIIYDYLGEVVGVKEISRGLPLIEAPVIVYELEGDREIMIVKPPYPEPGDCISWKINKYYDNVSFASGRPMAEREIVGVKCEEAKE